MTIAYYHKKIMSHENLKKKVKFHVPTCPVFAGLVTNWFSIETDSSKIEDVQWCELPYKMWSHNGEQMYSMYE